MDDIQLPEVCCSVQFLQFAVRDRLVISRTGKITLPDFGDKEVKLDQLSKAVYFLFLRHPEGIRFKELCDMKDELLDIYLEMTVKEDMDAIHHSFPENKRMPSASTLLCLL